MSFSFCLFAIFRRIKKAKFLELINIVTYFYLETKNNQKDFAFRNSPAECLKLLI